MFGISLCITIFLLSFHNGFCQPVYVNETLQEIQRRQALESDIAAARDGCYVNADKKCDECVSSLSCIWCGRTKHNLPACVKGSVIGPDNTTLCFSSEGWFWYTCKLSGFAFSTTFTYVIIIVLIIIVILLLLILICISIYVCCYKRKKKMERDERQHRKDERLKTDEKKKEAMKTVIANTKTNTDNKSTNQQTNKSPTITNNSKPASNPTTSNPKPNTDPTTSSPKPVSGATTNRKSSDTNIALHVIPVADESESVTEEIEVESFDDIKPAIKNRVLPGSQADIAIYNGDKEENDSNIEELVLAAMNYWTLHAMEEILSPKLSKKVLTRIVQDRVRHGGVFWNIQQLSETLSSVQDLIDMNDAMAYSVNDIFKFIYRSIDVDHEILMFVTPAIVPNCSVSAAIDGHEALERIADLIKNAEKFIHLSVMLFMNDPEGQIIAQSLIEAARDGVKVRVMVDKTTTMIDEIKGHLPSLESFKRGDFGLLAKQMKKAGIQILRTDPEIFDNIYWKKHKRPELAQLGVPELFLKIQDMAQKHGRGGSLNCVYHRKMMIIDENHLLEVLISVRIICSKTNLHQYKVIFAVFHPIQKLGMMDYLL